MQPSVTTCHWRTKDYTTLHKKRIFRYSLESLIFQWRWLVSRCVYMWIGECMWPVIVTVLLKVKRLQVTSETLLLVTNRRWYMTYYIVAIIMTLSDLVDHSPTGFFIQLYSSWQDIKWQSTSRGPSAIAKPLILLIFWYIHEQARVFTTTVLNVLW